MWKLRTLKSMNTKLFIFQIPAQIFICSNSFLYCFPDLLQKFFWSENSGLSEPWGGAMGLRSRGGDTYGVDFVPGHYHHDWHGPVHQGQGPMLQLPSQNTLRVHIGQLFYFLEPNTFSNNYMIDQIQTTVCTHIHRLV